MPNDDRTKIIHRGTPESAAMLANVKRAMAITAASQPFDVQRCGRNPGLVQRAHRQEGRRQLSADSAVLYSRRGEIRVGQNVFINQNCTFYDLGGTRHWRRCDDRAEREHHHGGPSRRTFAAARLHNRKAHRDREKRMDRSRRDHHRWRNRGREFGRRGGFGCHQGRSPEYSCRRKSGEGHSFDWRLRARLFCVSQNSPIFDLKSPLQQSCFLRGTRAREGTGAKSPERQAVCRKRLSLESMDQLSRKTISSAPKFADRTPFAFVVDSFLVRAPDYAIGHRDRSHLMLLDKFDYFAGNFGVGADVAAFNFPGVQLFRRRILGRHDADSDLYRLA